MVESYECISLTCDCCGKTYQYEDDDGQQSYDIMDIQEFTTIRFTGGYGSIFGDGETFECHLCQQCLSDKLGEYLRNITEMV